MTVQAVLKVTCLHFELSILGLNSSTTYYKQEEGINTWKKYWAKLMHSILQDMKPCLLLGSERSTSLQTLYCRFGIMGHYSEIPPWSAPGDLPLLLCQTHVNLNIEVSVTWKIQVVFVSSLFHILIEAVNFFF